MYDIKTLSWSAFNCCIDAERVPSLGSFMMISLEELAEETVSSLPRTHEATPCKNQGQYAERNIYFWQCGG
jgi:hypothetical protein